MTASASVVDLTVDSRPDLTRLWRRWRWPIAVTASVLGIAVLVGIATSRPTRLPLDPRATSANGAHALAALLAARGVTVTPVASIAATPPGADDTVLIADPGSVELDDLARVGASGATVVLIAPSDRELAAVGAGLRVVGDADEARLAPRCNEPVATTAGDIRYAGTTYAGPSRSACYRSGNGAGLVVSATTGRRTVVFGSPMTLTNGQLAHRGDAALALGLLSEHPRLLWLLPRPPQQPASDVSHKGLFELLPSRLLWALAQVLVAVVVLALWRARRLGPPVPEPLPVVVRAIETVEGRARLLRAAGARDTAAHALRRATRDRLRALLALDSDAPQAAMTDVVSVRTGRPTAQVAAVLYGAEPADDEALVRLAADLDDIERAVRRS